MSWVVSGVQAMMLRGSGAWSCVREEKLVSGRSVTWARGHAAMHREKEKKVGTRGRAGERAWASALLACLMLAVVAW